MSTGSWLKAHRKQVVTHTSIVVGFVLFLILVSVPLFDRLEAVQGESNLVDFPPPTEGGNITYYLDDFVTDGHIAVEVTGWVFMGGVDSENSKVYIVLKSDDWTYVFDTTVMMRVDVTEAFDKLNLNLDYSGFTALIPARRIGDGEYTIGFYITKDGIEALQYTNKAIVKSGDTIKTG